MEDKTHTFVNTRNEAAGDCTFYFIVRQDIKKMKIDTIVSEVNTELQIGESMEAADVSKLDAKHVIALLTGAVQSELF